MKYDPEQQAFVDGESLGYMEGYREGVNHVCDVILEHYEKASDLQIDDLDEELQEGALALRTLQMKNMAVYLDNVKGYVRSTMRPFHENEG